MGYLRISLFGGVYIEHSEQQVEIKLTRTIQALLAYLLLQRHRNHPRDVLAGIFWGDYNQDRARGCLNTAIWRLRRLLEPEGTPLGTYLITTSQGEIGFNWESKYWLDVAEFAERADYLLSRPVGTAEEADIKRFEATLKLYTGELLEGFYDDWALREREHFRMIYLDGLAYLMKYYYLYANFEQSLAYGQQILLLDPLREDVRREMMRLYDANGQRTLALRQYADLQKILDNELGIRPMIETQAIYRQIANDNPPLEWDTSPAGSWNYQQVRQQLRHTLDLIEEVKEQVLDVLRQIEAVADKHEMK